LIAVAALLGGARISTVLADILDRSSPERPALIVPDGPVISYAQLGQIIPELSHRLAALGVGRGDRVAMAFPNGPEAILLFLAISGIATACPLNPAYTESEFRFYLEDTGARFLIVPPGEMASARAAMGPDTTLIEAELGADGKLRLESHAPPRTVDGTVSATDDDVALVLHTSGTTSRPKRVPLKHRNLTASVRNIVSGYQLTAEDVTICVMPLFHVHGLVASALSTLATGGTVVVPRKFSPMGFWPVAQAVRPTWFTASPTPHQLILMRARGNRPPGSDRLRFVRSCSSALSPAQMAEMETRLGAPVLEAYGMTEASHQMASNPLPPGKRVPGSVGYATGIEIVVLDEAGRLMPPGASGEVSIKGPNVIEGYENNPRANAESFTNGWFRTGDQGSLDERGYLRLLGRIKELINRGGEKIAPREIDEVLESHPAVKEAVAFGVSHPTWGEEVAAAVVVSSAVTEKELASYCRLKLADFKVPKTIHIVEAIPRTPTGKVQRRFVAQQFSG
jgi:acyl-CoA synthetase (AMP-forming)/AMP-acid ligase II